MGSPAAEAGRYDREGPLHPVAIAYGFAVARNDVTFDQWDACAKVGGCSKDIEDYGFGRGTKPAVGVNFEEASRYAAWLSLMTESPTGC